ncbi:TonB-dependent receptor plug [Gemmatirosa kalamazoonensis]|uniref:TonB-dependent receptor plug n=1 Tax=Gemmatirosa kalamazoonensis TaxID=861299 RepID=W0RIN0_9BACT|nr:carboxypeptidase-like regulatory domain-containing protein [Gemmatirosa kalamazoonensis]AHG89248.1 TonB-dependent receptor plug [Gemmatirosa kalamazoonensis]
MRARRDAVVAASLAVAALAARDAGAQQPALGAVYGVVYDSLGHGPLARAYVQIVRADDLDGGRTVAADAAGAFRIDSLGPGRYLVGFFHPLLDLLRVEATPRVVDLGAGDGAVRVDLGVPDLARVRPVVCGSPQASTDSSGLLAGRVRDAVDGAPVPNATVVLTWSEVSVGARGLRTEHRRVPITTGRGGSFVLCGVPSGEELVASAAVPGRASGEVALELPPRGFVVRDLLLGDTASAARGTARLTGTVRDSDGRPVRGARAFVWGAAASATVDANGAFTLGGLPAGTRTLELRAIGFAARRVAVDLSTDRTGSVDVRMERTAVALGPVTVFGTPSRQSPLLTEFLDRQRHNAFGRFLTAADLDRAKPTVLSAALRDVPGLQITPDGHLGNMILGRGKLGSGTCQALLFLDGMPVPPGDRIDDFVDPQQVAGIEVYADPAYAPPQYASGRLTSCSIVLIWSRH